MKLNVQYLKTKPGILNAVLLGLLLLDFICILAGGSASATQVFFLIATIVGAIATNILVIVSLFSLNETLKLPWAFIEFIYVIAWAIFFLIVAALALARGGSYIAAGVFGLFTAIWYILKIVYLYITEIANPPATPYPTTA